MMDEERLDHLLSRVRNVIPQEPFFEPSRTSLIYDALIELKSWTKSQIKGLQDAQAHQQSKERRREERLAESQEGFENPYESGQKDGSEDGKVQSDRSEIYKIANKLAAKIAIDLGCVKYSSSGNLECGTKFKVTVEFE